MTYKRKPISSFLSNNNSTTDDANKSIGFIFYAK